MIAEILKSKYNIDTRVAYKMPIYRQKIYSMKKIKYKKYDCKNAEFITKRILNLPIYPSLSLQDVNYIANCINNLV